MEDVRVSGAGGAGGPTELAPCAADTPCCEAAGLGDGRQVRDPGGVALRGGRTGQRQNLQRSSRAHTPYRDII